MTTTTSNSFYWFDYETFGRSPRWDRPAQFAGLRTDLDLNPIGTPDMFYCRLADDYLPDPGACRITGITPDTVAREGLCESDFIARAVAHLGAPGTVSIGYNSVRFDDEFTRHTLFRNLREPYAHEWRDGNSRWDLLDVVRLARALRPDGMVWPVGENGRPINTLEALASANGIGHAQAHDALSDVEATLGLARCLKRAQPALFDYLFSHRGKAAAATLLNVRERRAVLISSSRVPRERHHLAAVVPLCRQPDRPSNVIVLDLHTDPDSLPGLEVDALRLGVFGSDEERAGAPRIGLFPVKLNACPVLAPMGTLRPDDAERLGMDATGIAARTAQLHALLEGDAGRALCERVAAALQREWPHDSDDVDGSLYGGGFIGDADRRRLDALLSRPGADTGADTGEALADDPTFDDHRLSELVFRWSARNWPDALSPERRQRWLTSCRERLAQRDAPWLSWDGFDAAMADADWREEEAPLRAALQRYASELSERVGRRRS